MGNTCVEAILDPLICCGLIFLISIFSIFEGSISNESTTSQFNKVSRKTPIPSPLVFEEVLSTLSRMIVFWSHPHEKFVF